MMKHFLLLATILAVLGMFSVSAKSYDIVFTNAVKVGTLQLAPGEYSLKLKGGDAVFTKADNGKSFTTAAKVENADKKFEQTSFHAVKDGNTDKVEAIELQGSTTKLRFN